MKKVLKAFAGVFVFAATAASVFSQARKTEVWDFGGVPQDGAHNNISVSDIDAISILGADGRFTNAKELEFGNLTLNVLAKDRMYTSGKKNAGKQSYATLNFGDGYVANGIYYCNGTGGEGRRYMLVKNVKAGDTVTFYAGTSNTSMKNIHFAHVELQDVTDTNTGATSKKLVKTGIQDESAPVVQASPANPGRYSYVAKADGSYKVYTDSDAGKPVFFRLVHIPGVEVKGSLKSMPKGTAGIKFVSQEGGIEIDGTVKGSSYSANLASGYVYTAVLTGIKGYGIDAREKTINMKDAASGSKKSLDLTVAESKTIVVSGNINGFDAAYDVSKLVVVMNPGEDSLFQKVDCEVEKTDTGLTFKGEVEQGVKYTAELKGANDYVVDGDAVFNGLKNIEKAIAVKAKPVYTVKGNLISGKDALSETAEKLVFTNMADGYAYEAKVEGTSYTVSLRDGTYAASSETANFKTSNHVIVEGKEVSKDMNYVAKAKDTSPVLYKKDIFVGGKKSDYATVSEAVSAAARMGITEEKQRVTIHIAPGVYREQIIIEAPYITLKNDTPSQEVKLTWYYGIGYKYYSADISGYYNADSAHDKFEKGGAAKWGVATFVKASATAFRAENITFEASFNKYVCDEEIADGVETDGSIAFIRRIDSDVTSKAATERATALCSEADLAEYVNCRFLGSQDTLYTAKNGSGKQYFKNCYIEGQTDFIFGDGDVVFDKCEIAWCGYSTGSVGGYLTAARTSSDKGYLFNECVITGSDSLKVVPGYWGRPWGAEAKVAFVNTILTSPDLIIADGWTSMSGNAPEKANFREINTTLFGEKVDTSKRTAGTVIDSAKGYSVADFLGDFKPVSAAANSKSKSKFAKKPGIFSNDDINTPYPGHTLTVFYSLGAGDNDDESDISWYSEKDGKKTLVKNSRGYASKTYLIADSDQNAKITVVVTPKAAGQSAGKPVKVELKAAVKEGHAVVATAGAGGFRDDSKLNIFLAGDSTVKDYTAKGMWSAGKDRDEGSWGEYLQNYLNGSIAVQNYANGGRSTRNFINEGSLAKIESQIGKGDYLFIQFGHNDENLGDKDRYVLLGKPDGKGIYPVTEGKKGATNPAFVSKYGAESYTEECGGSYKWFLKQYIDVARNKGATPVLVTPVSRLYFTEDGKIRPHHDADNATEKADTYCEAVRQLAKEENVLLIDGFLITKGLYEKTLAESTLDDTRKLMVKADTTHNSKIGGFIVAGLFAKEIKAKIPALSKAFVKPAKVAGVLQDGKLEFSVNSQSKVDCENKVLEAAAQKIVDEF